MAQTIKHWEGCTSDYPEKLANEEAQEITQIPIDDNEVVHQCVDCGAFIIMKNDVDNKSDK